MKIDVLQGAQHLRERFIQKYVVTWEQFQILYQDFIEERAKKGYPIDKEWYHQAYLWDKMHPDFKAVSFSASLASLRQKSGYVLFMSEDETHNYPGKLFPLTERITNFVARMDSVELAELIEREWFDDYRLAEQNMYNPAPVLPEDLYVFDESMEWFIVFTHETADWESETDEPMKAAASRYCIVYPAEMLKAE